jgi:hypothetical protein
MNKNSLKKSMESLMRRNPEIEIVKTGLPKKLMIKRIEVLKKSRESLIGGRAEIEIVKTGLPKKLVKRIKVVCENKEMSIQDFVSDAIIEKLELVHKERRKKQRL